MLKCLLEQKNSKCHFSFTWQSNTSLILLICDSNDVMVMIFLSHFWKALNNFGWGQFEIWTHKIKIKKDTELFCYIKIHNNKCIFFKIKNIQCVSAY